MEHLVNWKSLDETGGAVSVRQIFNAKRHGDRLERPPGLDRTSLGRSMTVGCFDPLIAF